MEAIISIFMYVVGLFILYLVITVAVRHGIDNSEAGRAILKKWSKPIETDTSFRRDDLDKD